jgi:hypothetical protein
MNFMVGTPAGVFFRDMIDMTAYKLSADSGRPQAYSRFVANHHIAIEKFLIEQSGRDEVTTLLLMDGAMRCAGEFWEAAVPYSNFAVCFPHSMDKICEDMYKLPWVGEIIDKTRLVSGFIYAHEVSLSLFRKFCTGASKNLVRPAGTRFAGEFYCIQSLHNLHNAAVSAVATDKWRTWLPGQTYRAAGEEVRDIINDESFHRDQKVLLDIMLPFLHALRLGDGDKCSIGFVYPIMAGLKDQVHDIIEAIADDDFEHGNGHADELYDIIDRRWVYLHAPIHAAAYAVNPAYLDDIIEELHEDVYNGFETVLTRFYHGDPEKTAGALEQFEEYKEAGGVIRGNQIKVASANKMKKQAEDGKYSEITPWIWWKTHGRGLPLIRKFAIAILTNQSGIGASERAHKETKQTHTKCRNRVQAQRGKRRVYIRHNVRLLDKLALENPYTEAFDEPEDISSSVVEPSDATSSLEAITRQQDEAIEADMAGRLVNYDSDDSDGDDDSG